MTAAEFATHIKDAKRTQGVAWTGRCPAHEDVQSSLSWQDKDDKVLLHCHAGCKTEAVVAALAFKMSDLFHHPKKKPAAHASPLTIETLAAAKGFEVEFLKSLGVEQHGGSVMITHRMMDGSPAARHQLRHAGSPRFTWSKGPGEIVPYGLDRLADTKAQGYLLLVEGASDCWSAWLHHVPCLGIPGADMTKKLLPEHLEGVGQVYVVKEPGNGGLTFTAGLEVRLAEFGYTGKASAIEMPFGLKDVNELHQKYLDDDAGFLEALQSAIHTAAPTEKFPPDGAPPAPAGKTYVLAPFGNSERLVDAYGTEIAFVNELGWLSWTGHRWKLDPGTHLVQRRAKSVITTMDAEADALLADGADKSAAMLKGWAVRCMTRAAVNEMLDLTEERVHRDHSDFDSHPMLFNVANGTLDLTTGTLNPHAREDYITQLSPAMFDSAALAPTWELFLGEIMCGRESLVHYLQRLVGYALTGNTKEQSLEILHGDGANGKSTFLEVLRALMGQEYARQAPAHALMQKKYDAGPSPDIARLRGSRLVTAVEPEKGRKLAEGLIKAMTGNDMQSARHLYKEPIEFATTHKLVIACNHKPRIPSTGHAMWRRIHLVPFDARFDGQKADKEMPTRLRAELSGILNWAIEGCLAWQEQGLNPPAEVLAATRAYEQEEDELGEFWTDCCEVDPKAKLPRADLRRAYLTWCEENGMEPMSVTAFGLAVKEKGVQAPTRAERFQGKPTKLYHGVRLVTGVTTVTGEAGVENFAGDGEAEPDVKISTFAKAVTPVTPVTPVTRLELCPHGNPRLRCDLCCKHGKLPHRCISCSGHGNMAGSGNAVARRRMREEAPKMDLGSYYFSREDMLTAIDRLPPHVEPPHNRGECEWRECPEHPLDPENRFDPRNDVDLPEEEEPR